MGAPKNFYNAVDQAKLGIDQIPGMVKDIADIKEDISEITPLPDVTSEDNGDVLTVIDGAWGKGTPDKVTILDVTISGDTATINSDLTFDDIIEKIFMGDDILFKRRIRIGSRDNFDQFYRVVFNQKMVLSNTIIAYRCNPVYESSDEPEDITTITHDFLVFYESKIGYFVSVSAGLPDVTSDDNGDLLEVVSGAWSKSSDVKDKIQFLYDYLNLTGDELIHEWDFTTSLNDKVGSMNMRGNGTCTPSGYAIGANNIELPNGTSFLAYNQRAIIEFGLSSYASGTGLFSRYTNSVTDILYWDNTDQTWKILSNGVTTVLPMKNPNYFSYKKLQIKVGSTYDDVEMSTQDGTFFKGHFDLTASLLQGFAGFTFGGTFNTINVVGIKIYQPY